MRGYLNDKDYQQGYQAYKRGDCQAAIAHFTRVSDRWTPSDIKNLSDRAKTKISECTDLQKALEKQQAGEEVSSLIAYNKLLGDYPDTEFRDIIQKNAETLLTQTHIAKLTDLQLCNQLDSFRENQIVAIASQHLPPLYQSCGKLYHRQEKYTQAIALYEQFLKAYPEHKLATAIKEKLARSIVAEAKQQGATTILPPLASGYTNSGHAVLEIQNDSPTKMQVVFIGPETKIEEIEPCTDCEEYIFNAPDTCPAKGPVGRYILKPGQYSIVVKSANKFRVNPYRGYWKMDEGTAYKQCFYIRNPIDKKQKEKDSDSENRPKHDNVVPSNSFQI